ncbi:MAG TPA: hypothetical protein VFM22_10235 [Castellaniella sp.]|jgi:hypothetical protein|nr:hypothetical protein [Castellaniella sp.]
MNLQTLIVESRGRKYFHCRCLGRMREYNAKVLINDVSENWRIGQTVVCDVSDTLTKRNGKYGVELVFEPLYVVDGSVEDALETNKWLGYALSDAQKTGRCYATNAIKIALTLRPLLPHHEEQMATLKSLVDENRAFWKVTKYEEKSEAAAITKIPIPIRNGINPAL